MHLQPGRRHGVAGAVRKRRQFGWLPRRYRAGARLYYTQPCGRLLAGHLERVGLRPNFRLQDELQWWNLLHRRFDEVFGPDQRELKHRGWKDAPNVIRNALPYIDRICDELILPRDLIRSRSPFLPALGRCYRRYERLLLDENAADFAHLQAWADLLLDDDDIAGELSGGIRSSSATSSRTPAMFRNEF